ncbi:TetR/AcrR family transcriptional regulator [Streptomyces litchfieldiae]|uniref:TetR/AcrR family transcriptional regulator n=1 Tax=Streptomyces litchfieldiae TaxID=3075543 RepID=A0ABU2MR91_9ACTN|nr:TetR/AcrR family transcriptional regulator [Streptomyces sp. DSM 44938]MDT0344040.1 TetR/AcrR family transcriptional regulator [Streptomyces sp. DSM 44938]
MSTPTPPATAQRLLDAAARLLSEEGPAALTTRRLAREVGASTMAVYTHFGSLAEVVRGVIHEGFRRLADRLRALPETDDPVADLATMCRESLEYARAEPHLVAVMFGGTTLAGFELREDDLRIGGYALRILRDLVARCMAAGRFRAGDPMMVTRHLWCQMHGLTQLERAGYFAPAFIPEGYPYLEGQLRDFAVGAGDTLEAATRSVEESVRRSGARLKRQRNAGRG